MSWCPKPCSRACGAASEKSKEHAVAEGIAIAREMLERVRGAVQGAQVSAPFGKVELAVRGVRELSGGDQPRYIAGPVQRGAHVKGILIIDHGSVKDEANHMLECVGELVQRMAGERVVVRVAHMELAAPTIADGFESCVAAGATEIVVFPYMLSPGQTFHARHPAHGRGDLGRSFRAFRCR